MKTHPKALKRKLCLMEVNKMSIWQCCEKVFEKCILFSSTLKDFLIEVNNDRLT